MATICRAPFTQQKREFAVENEMIFTPVVLYIDIDYVPDRLCVESKSLKFYLASYRNERAFNEAVTNRILDDFVRACAPREAIVTAQFSARGGIALTVRAEYADKKTSPKKLDRDGR